MSKRVIVLVAGVSHGAPPPIFHNGCCHSRRSRFRRECRRHASPKNFLQDRLSGSGYGGASSGLPKRHSPLTFRFAFPSPFSLLPSFLFPASVQYTMVAVIRCNGGEWVGGVSLRVAGTGRYRSERGGEVGWRDSREFFKKSTTNERTNERRNAMHTRGEDEKEWGKKERKKGRREKEEELQKFLRFNARGAPARLMKTVT